MTLPHADIATNDPLSLPAASHPAAFHNGWRSRFNAWFFLTFDRYLAVVSSRHKRVAFSSLEAGRIVELGSGVGANLDYLPAGSRLVAIEPNLAMHAGLLERAAQRGVEIDVLADDAAHLALPDSSVDDVLCSLVLCTVADPDAVVAEVRRVLRPGGRFRFVEHVAAPRWSPRRWLQHGLRRPWKWIYEGCDLCRDTARTIEAAGFAQVQLDRRRLRRSCFVPVNTSVCGIATN